MKPQSTFSKVLGIAILSLIGTIAHAQNFGVDVPSPQEKLDVNGAIRIGNTTNSNAGSIRYSSVSQKFQVNIAGTWYDLATTSNAIITNVAFNTTTNQLTITEGGNNFAVDLTDLQDNTDDQSISYNAGTNVISLEDGGTVDLSGLQDNTDNQNLAAVYGEGGNTVTLTAADGNVRFIRGVNTEVLTMQEASGNIGIGTSNPAKKLEIVGDVRISGVSGGTNGSIVKADVNGDLSASGFPNDNDQVLDGTGNWVDINTMVSGDYIENQSLVNQAATFNISGDGLFNGGNVGIGTTAANNSLQVNDASGRDAVSITETDLGNGVTIIEAGGGDGLHVTNADAGNAAVFEGGNVGVGTAAPLASLNVYEPSASPIQSNFKLSTNDAGILVTSDYTNGDYTPGIFWSTQNENPTKPKAGIYLQTSTAGSKMYLATSTDYSVGITNDAMVIDDNGNIGIGTVAPDQKLELSGGGMQINGSYGIGFNGSTPANDAVLGDRARVYYDDNFFGANTDALIIEKTDGNSGSPDGGIAFTNKGSDNTRDASMVIRGNGKVGIGSIAPTQALDVVGDINTSSGFMIGNTATSGEYLRGNGTRYVSSTIPYTDITGVPSSLPPSGAAGGDLAGTYPNPTIAANAVGSAEIANNAVGSSEIASNAVTNTDLADMAANTVKGNPTAASADPADIAVSGNSVLGRLGGNIVSIPMGTTASSIAWGDHTHGQLHNQSHAMASTSDHTATAWRLFYSNAAGQVTEMDLGSGGQVLKSNGAAAAPTWQTDDNTGNITGTGANGRATYWTGTSTQSSDNSFLWDAANNRLGIGTTTAAATKLNVYNAANATKTVFTQALPDAGALITSNYADGAYTPGLFWSTTANNPTKPKAGIFLQTNVGGSKMFLSTSNNFSTGITNDGIVINESGNVGIGTNNPTTKLNIDETYTATVSEMARFVHRRADVSDSDEGSYFAFKVVDGNNAGDGFDHARISWKNNGTGADENEGELGLWTATNGITTEKMTIKNNGNVGIGTNTPTQKLEVAGDARVTGLGGSGTKLVQTDNSGNLSESTIDPSATPQGTGTTNYVARWTSGTALGTGATYDNGTNVGIGIVPAYKLDVNGAGIRLSTNVGINTNPRTDSYRLDMGGHIDMSNYQINYVDQLHFNDNVRFYGDGSDNYLYYKYGDAAGGGMIFYDGDNTRQGYVYADGNATNPSFGFLDGDGNWGLQLRKDDYTRFLINNSEKVRIISNGNVGIGTTGPTEKLHVEGNIRIANNGYIDDDATLGGNADDWVKLSGYVELKSNTDNYGIVLRDKDNTEYFGMTQVNGSSYLTDNSTYSNYFIRGNGANAYTRGDIIVQGSDVYENSGSLRLNGEDNVYISMDYNNDDANNRAIMFGRNDEGGDGNWGELMRIAENGNVGIGTTNPTYKLYVNGRLKTTAINETSDARLKKNVQPIDAALAKVEAMNGVTYDWKRKEHPEMNLEKGTQYGVIAQELEKVIPELVETDGDGWKSVEYSHLVPVLIEAIKELNSSISELQATVAEMQGDKEDANKRIESLAKKMAVLESMIDVKTSTAGQ